MDRLRVPHLGHGRPALNPMSPGRYGLLVARHRARLRVGNLRGHPNPPTRAHSAGARAANRLRCDTNREMTDGALSDDSAQQPAHHPRHCRTELTSWSLAATSRVRYTM